jgi:acetylornithine deacetylase/succinyl-diaminopimelate desuccinylase-like protein
MKIRRRFSTWFRKVVNDPNVDVRWGRERYRPAGGARIDTEAYRVLEAQTTKHYNTTVLPTMGTGATDMSNLRAKGIECYGIGPALDSEDAARASARTAIRSAFSKASSIALCVFSRTSSSKLARAR